MPLLGLCLETFFQCTCTILSYPGQPLLSSILLSQQSSQVLSGLRTRLCANQVDVLTVRSVFPSNVHINILRGLPCRLESLRLTFTNEPSIFVDGDLAESIKRDAFDRLGDLVPQVRARTFQGFFTAWRFLAFVLKLSFNVL